GGHHESGSSGSRLGSGRRATRLPDRAIDRVPVLRLLRKVSLPQLSASWGRTALIVGGIATGVSLIVAIGIINTSVVRSIRRTIELIAGPAALEVVLGVGEVGFDQRAADIVRADPGVAAAIPLGRGTITLADDPAQPPH